MRGFRRGRPSARSVAAHGPPEPAREPTLLALLGLSGGPEALRGLRPVELDQIAGRLARRSAVASGASWADVASSLGLEPEVAERAYGRSRGLRG